jgi:NAD(P)-dependent dehydrogenase (short-subunit alcohol dehydrogenase family)
MSGRAVIVTGASSGIGAAVARAFGRAGDRVVLAARRLDRLQAIAETLPDALAVAADLSQVEDIGRVVSAASVRFGAVDVLVNNAGVGHYDWLERLTEDDIHDPDDASRSSADAGTRTRRHHQHQLSGREDRHADDVDLQCDEVWTRRVQRGVAARGGTYGRGRVRDLSGTR